MVEVQRKVPTMADAKSDSGSTPTLRQLTPVLIVDEVEPCVKFWTDRLGFELTNKVPDDNGKLIFASVLSEDPGAARDLTGHSVALFITVDDLDSIEKALDGAPVVKARHDTFYGSTEIYVREPGGNTVGFAQFS
jgi:catechol 2,3-dioxygenase-like lactoylglutathione lyase family enzyme